MEPRLPRELERTIFEIAARSSRRESLRALMLVAHRVRTWLQHIQHEVLVINGPDPINWPRGAYTQFIRRNNIHFVKHLLLVSIGDPEEWEHLNEGDKQPKWGDVLSQCPNLQDLAIWCFTPSQTLIGLTAILKSPLRTNPCGLLRLSISLIELFPNGEVDLSHEVLKDLTHLEVLDFGTELEKWEAAACGREVSFGCLKNLRYLAFQNYHVEVSLWLERIKRCLRECEKLEVLAIGRVTDTEILFTELSKVRLKHGTRQASQASGLQENCEDGPVEDVPEYRVVVNPSPDPGNWEDDWIRGTEGGVDFWTAAKRIVIERRRSIASIMPSDEGMGLQ